VLILKEFISVLSSPIGAVEGPVLNRFPDVTRLDIFGGIEIGNRARDFQNAVVGARR
jgi:UDP-N-acetylglucosamine enolpyruvyl transferase